MLNSTKSKKVLKKHGFNMTMLKKMAVKERVTLNEDFIHEITKKQISRKKKKKAYAKDVDERR